MLFSPIQAPHGASSSVLMLPFLHQSLRGVICPIHVIGQKSGGRKMGVCSCQPMTAWGLCWGQKPPDQVQNDNPPCSPLRGAPLSSFVFLRIVLSCPQDRRANVSEEGSVLGTTSSKILNANLHPVESLLMKLCVINSPN